MAPTSPFNETKIHLHKWVACAVLAILWSSCAFAQMDTAILVGRVADPSGAAIWRAQVELIDVERNTKTRARTNATGLYIFPNTKPGHYRVNVSASGYKTVVLTSLTIYVQDDIQQNFSMAAGSPLESVTLATNGTPVETTGTVGTVVDQTLVKELPLNGRSFQTLFQLTPGIVITPASFSSQGQFSVNGQRTNTNYIIVDGVSANVAIAAGVNPGQSAGGSLPAVTAFGGTNSLVSTDDVQEFAVLTSSYSPEFGRMPGAQVSVVTRSGTNEFHGDIFDYVRNDAFDANDWFANRDRLKRAALRQNDYGIVFGGPLLKDNTFLFASYEGLRLRQPTSRDTDVPSVATRNSVLASMKPFFNAYPLPNGPEEGNGLAHATYAFSDPSSLDTVGLRIDQHVGEALGLFARYDYSTSNRNQRGTAVNSLSTVSHTGFILQTFTAGLTYRVSPTIMNDLRLNWSFSSALGNDELDSFAGAIPLTSQFVFPSGFSEQNGLFQFLPALGPQNLRLSFGKNIQNSLRQVALTENMSVQIGPHLMKAGVDVRMLSPKIAPAEYTQASFFADIRSAAIGTSLLSTVAGSAAVRSTFNNVSVYLQDRWKLYSRLNVTYGMRWDYNPTPTGRGANGLQPFSLTNTNNLSALSLGPPGAPIYHSTLNNFAPRFGFAYEIVSRAERKLVLRTGLGMFYDLGNGPAGNAFDGTNFPFSAQKVLTGAAFPLGPVQSAVPTATTSPPFSPVVAFSSRLKLPYTWQWNVTLQQMLGSEQALTIGYVGAAGHSLLQTGQYVGGVAGVPQAFTQILLTDNAGYSRYDSLQVRLERRARTDLHFIASYTYSHSLDNISTDVTFNSIPSRFLDRRANYGPSDFDVRQTATLGADYSLHVPTKSCFSRIVLSNWSFDPIVILRSAPPVDVVLLRSVGSGQYLFRPDLVPGVDRYVYEPTVPGGRRFNVLAFAVPATERQGDLGRNSFRGFSLAQADFSIRRKFAIKHLMNVQLRIEAFNLFNHSNFSAPVGQLGSIDSGNVFSPQTGFGISPSTAGKGLASGSFNAGFSSLYQIGGARSLQLALKFEF